LAIDVHCEFFSVSIFGRANILCEENPLRFSKRVAENTESREQAEQRGCKEWMDYKKIVDQERNAMKTQLDVVTTEVKRIYQRAKDEHIRLHRENNEQLSLAHEKLEKKK
jgi:hypothetical protein